MQTNADVVITGGGLAGLTLALQIRARSANLSIVVLERDAHPAPLAAHKVGESSVELGAHYFAEIMGFRPHLKDCQLPKLGIRVWVKDRDETPLEKRLEIGSTRYLPTSTYQIDRGKFENFLGEECLRKNICFKHSAQVRTIVLGEKGANHEVTFKHEGTEQKISARWIVDASGRAALLKKKLGLEEEASHRVSSSWFRIAAKINMDDWIDSDSWKEGHQGMYSRWFSTNHLMGKGYWVWIIPLSSGSTSIGIVADPRVHPLDTFNTFERALQWLDTNEPVCAREVRKVQDLRQDFIAIKNYSHRCKRLYSGDRWAITGDAGVFIDPLYSPGSDFIGISNSFITDLIAKESTGMDVEQYSRIYNSMFQALSENTFKVFEDQYSTFGNPRVVMLKIAWDYAVYWSFLAFVAIQQQFCNVQLISKVSADLDKVSELNRELQIFLRKLAEITDGSVPHSFIDLSKIEYIFKLNESLKDDLTEQAFADRLSQNIDRLGCFARELVERVRTVIPAMTTPESVKEFPHCSNFLGDVYSRIAL